MVRETVFKRCTCAVGGRRVGAGCPRLRNDSGDWDPDHGCWGFRLELPGRGGRRRQLRRSGYQSRDEAIAARDGIRGLLDIAGDDYQLRLEIGDIIWGLSPGAPLPGRGEVA